MVWNHPLIWYQLNDWILTWFGDIQSTVECCILLAQNNVYSTLHWTHVTLTGNPPQSEKIFLWGLWSAWSVLGVEWCLYLSILRKKSEFWRKWQILKNKSHYFSQCSIIFKKPLLLITQIKYMITIPVQVVENNSLTCIR